MPGHRERTESVQLAQQLRQTQTPAETQMWQLLRNRRFCGLKFRRQTHIAGFIADFACLEQRLVVELDGAIHAEPEKAAADVRRDALLAERGWRTVRVRNLELLRDPIGVLERLRSFVTTVKSPE